MFHVLLAMGMSLQALQAQEAKVVNQGNTPWPPEAGKTTFMLTLGPRMMPQTLKQLADMSVAIIEGSVLSTSVRQLTPVRRLETDVTFQPTKILKGPQLLSPVVLAQKGG